MGIFDWIFGKRARFETRISRQREQMFDDLATQVAEVLGEDRPVLLLYAFQDTLAKLQDLFPDALALTRPSRSDIDGLRVGSGVHLLAMDEIPQNLSRVRPGGQAGIHLHLAELYPVPDYDQGILNLGTYLGQGTIPAQVAIKGPIFSMFRGSAIATILDSFDYQEGEVFTGGMLAKSVLTARKKIDRKTRRPVERADSCQMWLERNIRNER